MFKGTAGFYAKYRPAYPAELLSDIVGFYKLDGRGSLLDLGCGTGELAIPLAGYFDSVLAIDPEPGMLAAGKAKARQADIKNIGWQIGSDGTITGVKNKFRLVTMGQSLHWMNEKAAIDQVYDSLETPGGLTVVSGGGISLFSSKSQPFRPKDIVIKRLITRYLGTERRAGDSTYKPSDLSWEQDLFPKSKFGGFRKRAYQVKVVRDVDQELGYLYSMSWAKPDFFGDKKYDFEAEFRHELSAINHNGKFTSDMVFEAYFLLK